MSPNIAQLKQYHQAYFHDCALWFISGSFFSAVIILDSLKLHYNRPAEEKRKSKKRPHAVASTGLFHNTRAPQ